MFTERTLVTLRGDSSKTDHFQANPRKFTFDVVTPDTLEDVNALVLEVLDWQTGEVRANIEIVNPAVDPVEFQFTGEQLNWTGRHRLVLNAVQPDKDGVPAKDLVTLHQGELILHPHYASLTTGPAPTPVVALTAAQAASLYATLAQLAALQEQVDALGEVDLSAYSTTVQMNNALALKAPLASPALTGVPTAPTATTGDDSTQISTTAFVQAAVANGQFLTQSVFSAKGVFLVGTGDTTFEAVAVGTDGQVLTANSATTTGVEWATPSAPALASITGLGTSVGAALAVSVGTAGSFVVNGGAGGTPSSINLANATFPSSIVTLTGSQTLTNKSIDASQLTGLVGITKGGTGASTAATARAALGTDDAANITTGNLAVARIATALTTPGPIGGTTASTITATALTVQSATNGANAFAVRSLAGSSCLDINTSTRLLSAGGGAFGVSVSTGKTYIYNAGQLGWCAGSDVAALDIDTAFSRSSAGLLQINNGTAGTYRDLILRCLKYDRTDTAAGTTGAQTINKGAGTVNFAAAATSLVVTNSLVTATTKILATVHSNDTTAKSVAVVAASGSFTLYLNAAATAETAVAWQISG